jgi:hypothetical protein
MLQVLWCNQCVSQLIGPFISAWCRFRTANGMMVLLPRCQDSLFISNESNFSTFAIQTVLRIHNTDPGNCRASIFNHACWPNAALYPAPAEHAAQATVIQSLSDLINVLGHDNPQLFGFLSRDLPAQGLKPSSIPKERAVLNAAFLLERNAGCVCWAGGGRCAPLRTSPKGTRCEPTIPTHSPLVNRASPKPRHLPRPPSSRLHQAAVAFSLPPSPCRFHHISSPARLLTQYVSSAASGFSDSHRKRPGPGTSARHRR